MQNNNAAQLTDDPVDTIARAPTLIFFVVAGFAHEIASASGGRFGLFGGKIGEEDKSALALIIRIFGLVEDENSTSAAGPGDMASGSLPANLYPALKNADWASEAAADVVLEPLLGREQAADGDPVIAYVIDREETVEWERRRPCSFGLQKCGS